MIRTNLKGWSISLLLGLWNEAYEIRTLKKHENHEKKIAEPAVACAVWCARVYSSRSAKICH